MRVRALLLGVALAGLCGCHDEVGELPRAEPAGASDTRRPSGFDVPLPTGVTTRAGLTRDGRSVVLATSDASESEVRVEVREALSRRDWQLTEDGDVIIASVNGHERARVRVSRGLSGLIRIEASEARGGRIDAEPEPAEWRRVTRAPLPAPPGGAVESRCVSAIAEACADYVAHTEDDPLDCRMDHRAVCLFVEAVPYHERALTDAEARLEAAYVCHDRVLSPEARAETEALVRLERLAASAVATRAARAGAPPSERLAALLAASESWQTASTRGWWSEISAPSQP